MEQIAVSFTKEWSPATWLTPTVTILMRNWEKVVENWLCNELGYGWYIYNFERYSAEKVYLYIFDWGATLDDYDRMNLMLILTNTHEVELQHLISLLSTLDSIMLIKLLRKLLKK